MTQPVLETSRLILQPLTLEHAPALHTMYADRHAMRFWHTLPHRDLEETRAMVATLMSSSARCWVLCPRDVDRSAIGMVYYLSDALAAGMGYILHTRHWGKGLMSEAVRAALAFGFTQLGLERVELWIDVRNLASQRVAAHTGFERRSTFRLKYPHEATSHETIVYGLRAQEWQQGLPASQGRPLITTYGLQPVLAVPDVLTTAHYYRDKLGFSIMFVFGEPPTYGGVALSEWAGTGARIHLSKRDVPGSVDGLALFIEVGPGIDELHARYQANGVNVLGEVEQMPWGLRQFSARDCNGYVLRFATPA